MRNGLEQGHEVRAPDLRKRIGTSAIAPAFPLARQDGRGFDPSPGSLAEAGAGGGCPLGVTFPS